MSDRKITQKDPPPRAPDAPGKAPGDKVWIAVFVFCFIGLLIDGMDLMFLSYSLTSLKEEFGLSELQAGSLGSYSLVGMAAGGILGGWASDTYGRVRTLVWTIVIFSVGTALLGATHSYEQFAVVRLLSSFGLGAEYVVANTLMSEYVPTKYRTTALGALQAGWSVGYVAATLLARAIIPTLGWRWLFYVAIIPVIMVFFIRRIVPEPASWQAAAAERRREKTAGAAAERKSSPWRDIFAHPRHKRLFILWTLTAGFLQFGYYGVNNWLPRYIEKEMGISFKSMAGYLVSTYTAMILGKIVAGCMADRVGRRIVYVFGCLSAACFMPVIVYYHSPENILYLLALFGFLYGIPYGVGATYMTESFEAKVRGTAVGGAYNIGRAGAALAPAAIGYIATQASIGAGFLVMGGAYFLCGLIPALFIREKMYDPQHQ